MCFLNSHLYQFNSIQFNQNGVTLRPTSTHHPLTGLDLVERFRLVQNRILIFQRSFILHPPSHLKPSPSNRSRSRRMISIGRVLCSLFSFGKLMSFRTPFWFKGCSFRPVMCSCTAYSPFMACSVVTRSVWSKLQSSYCRIIVHKELHFILKGMVHLPSHAFFWNYS